MTFKRLKCKFIFDTLYLNITRVNRSTRNIHECEEQDNDLKGHCRKSCQKSTALDDQGNLAISEVVQENTTLTQIGMKRYSL